MTEFTGNFIGGKRVEPGGKARTEVRSSYDGSLIGSAPLATEADVDLAVSEARRAFDLGPWPRMVPEDRLSVLAKFTELHAARCDEFARFITTENATPLWCATMIQQGVAAQNAAYLQAAANYPWEDRREAFGGRTETVLRREPLGVVAAVVPWNAPHQSALAKLLPAFLAGCTVVLKLAPEAALSGQFLGELFMEAGLPEGALSILVADRQVSEYLVSHSDVDKIAFTGSTAAGKRIASVAAANLKRFSLELGGKSATILLPDAHAPMVAKTIRYSAMFNSGQACIAESRVLVPRDEHDGFVDALCADIQTLTVGDPREMETFIGPLVAERQQRRAWDLIDTGISDGATLVTGGSGMPPEIEHGAFVRPTVFCDVDNAMLIAREEIFGPVVCVIPYTSVDEAIAIANDSPYGLAGGIWSSDPDSALNVGRQIRTGTMSINGATPDFSAPFGGYKQSGIGREFGTAGIDAYVEHKAISI
ncbi:MAG: aldehyde dehydrogenase [Rhodobiaceae bacterium]|nr:aldehyde dehydrogenase [Rhodobiaceae bacterium]